MRHRNSMSGIFQSTGAHLRNKITNHLFSVMNIEQMPNDCPFNDNELTITIMRANEVFSHFVEINGRAIIPSAFFSRCGGCFSFQVGN